MSSLGKGFGIVGVSTVITKAINMAAFFLMAIYVGPHEFGALAACWIIISVGEAFFDLGFRESYLREKNPSDYIKHTCYWLFCILGCLWCLIAVVSGEFISDIYDESSISDYLLALSVIFIFRGMSSLRECMQIADRRYLQLSVRELLAVSFSICIGLLLLSLGFGVWGLIARYISESAFNYLLLLFQQPLRVSRYFDSSWVRGVVSSALQLSVSRNIGWLVTAQTERIFVGAISLSALGIWGFAKKPLDVSGQVSTSLIQKVYFRHFVDSAKEYGLRELLVRAVGLFLLLGLLGSAFLIVFALYFVDLIWGDNWASSKPIIIILAFAMPLGMVGSVLTGFLSAVGCTKQLLQISFFIAFVSVFFVAFGSLFGLAGAAWGVVFASLLGVLVMGWVASITVKKQWIIAQ